MADSSKSLQELMEENAFLKKRIQVLEQSEVRYRETQDAHRACEEKFAVSFLKSPIPLAITSIEDGQYIDVNEAFAGIMGITRDELMRNTSISAGFINAEQREAFLNEYQMKGFVENLELRMRTKDGDLGYGLFNSSKITIDGEEFYLTMVTDITERKQTEEELSRLKAVLDNTSDLVGAASPDGLCIYLNAAGRLMTGFGLDEDLSHRRMSDVHTTSSWQIVNEKGIPTAVANGVWEGETVLKNRDGVEIPVSQVIIAHRKVNGELDYLSTIMRNISERRQVQEALRASEEKFAVSFLKSPIPLAITSMKDGQYMDVNEAFARIMDLTRNELMRNTSISAGFITAEQREAFLNEYRMKGFVENLELRMHVKDGERRYGLFNSSKISIGGEEFFLTMVTDITERRLMEEARREIELKLQNLADNLSNVVVYQLIVQNDGRRKFNYVSRSVKQLCEVTQEEVLADAGVLYRMVLPEYQEVIRRCQEESLVTMSNRGCEYLCKLPSGKLRWFEAVSTPRREKNGTILCDGVAVDITDRKRLEEMTIMQERDLNKAIIDSLPGLFYVVDEQFRFLLWNKNFLNITGYSAEELEGMTVLDFQRKSDQNSIISEVRDAISFGETSVEAEVLLKDGTAKTFFFSSRKIIYNDKPCVVGTGFDITVRNRALEELRRSATELEEANTALRVFMKNQGKDKQLMGEKLQTNINDLVIPYLEKLKQANLDDRHKKYVSVLESHLSDILSPFMTSFLSAHKKLTPQEIQIVDLIKKGKNTKEIAELLNASTSTIATHRNNIRKKMKLRNAKINLRTHLMSIS